MKKLTTAKNQDKEPAVQTRCRINTKATNPGPHQLTLDAVKAHWRAMVAQVSQEDKNLPALLAMCKPLAVEGNIIILGFDFPIFKEKFDKTEHGAAIIGNTFF